MDPAGIKRTIKHLKSISLILLLIACGLSCKKKSNTTSADPQGPSNINFTIDVSTGPLSNNGGSVVQNGVIVARRSSGTFVAVAASCTYQGSTTLLYSASSSNFICPNDGSQFALDGTIARGPATVPIKKYNTSLSGNILHITS